MKKLLIVFAAVLLFSCQRQTPIESGRPVQEFPTDKELFNLEQDAAAANRKKPHPPKGGGGNPTDTTTPPTTTGTTVIYLDCDGEQVSGIWGNFYAEASGLNADQQQQIMAIVKLRYAGFPIEVTNSLSVFNSYPINKRMRVILTVNNTLYPGSGGVAYIGSYLWANDTPSFVFPNRYGYNINWVAFASTHEPGHMIGLRHQHVVDESCNILAEYRPGWNMGTYNGQTFIWGESCTQNDLFILNNNL